MFDPVIPNRMRYNSEMIKSLVDKAFFIDKIQADVFVDFGCADGALISFLYSLFPDKKYVGYDISEDELKLARTAVATASWFSEWDQVIETLKQLKDQGKTVALILNSVIHEVYSYSNPNEVEQFWNRIFGDDANQLFDWVVIRDMSVSRSVNRQSDTLNVVRVKQRFDQFKLMQYESHWGSINENWSLVHFLLKYRYTENWEREVRENYLPLNYEDLLARIPNNWDPTYHEHFTLPFIRQQVLKDFNIDLQDRTHVKLILRRIG